MKTYDQAPPETHERVAALIEKYHPQLNSVSVKVDLLMVSTDSETARALTHGGYPALAVVRSTNPKERAMGQGDALIVIDLERYESMDPKERDALLDHELYHLVTVEDKKTLKPKVDSHLRPVLKIRKHDRQFGWFDEIARRHGKNSIEVQQADWIRDEAGQTYFGFISGHAKLSDAGRIATSSKANTLTE